MNTKQGSKIQSLLDCDDCYRKIEMGQTVLNGWDILFLCVYFSFILFFIFIVVQVQLSPFSHPTPLSPYNPSLFWLCPRVLYTCSLRILSRLSSVIPLPLPSGLCQFVLHFSVSGSILLAVRFVD